MMNFRTKLLLFNLTMVLGLSLLAILLGLDFLRLANLSAQQKGIESKARSAIHQLTKASEIHLATIHQKSIESKLSKASDSQEIHRLIEGYRDDIDLAFIRVWYKKNTVVGEWGKAVSFKQVHNAPAQKVFYLNEDLLTVWSPVEIEGFHLGSVSLGYSLERLHSARQRIILFIALVIIAALAATLASIFFSTSQTRPILQMMRTFRQMADGDLQLPHLAVKSKDEIGQMAAAFNEMLGLLQQLGRYAQQLARGNLSLTITAKGDLADAFRTMIESQRVLVRQIAETAIQLTAAMTEFQSSAEQQERGAIEQSSAVEENQRTMVTLVESARQVAETAQSVLQNAERTHSNNRVVAERIAELSSHTQRIAEILQVIKDIANKSDLLALNAALEGTKAGEAGRGFSLVANQMQRLAENVVASVRDIKELTDTITEATRATVLAIEESTKLAGDTTRSARQIVLIIQQQQAGTEQMSKAMGDVSEIAHETTSVSKNIAASTRDLVQLSVKLHELVQKFSIEEQPKSTLRATPQVLTRR